MPRLPILLPAALVVLAPALQAQPEEEGRLLYRFRMNHLQENVGLTEEQARAVADRWARFDRDHFNVTRQIQDLRGRINDILLGPGTEDEKNARIHPLLEQFTGLRRQQAQLKLEFETDIRARLSPAQQARLILHVEDMQRRMMEALRQQGFGGGRLGPGLRSGPGPGGFHRGGGR